MLIRLYLIAGALLAVLLVSPLWSQDTLFESALPADTTATPGSTDVTGIGLTTPGEGGTTEVSSALQMANQAFQMLANRQFQQAKQLYEDAAGTDPRYQPMVQFVDNIITRYREMSEEMWALEMKYNNPLEPEMTEEKITREDLEKMLDIQMRMQMAQGDLMGEFTLAELGLENVKDADTLTLGEYLGWRRRKSADYRIYDDIMKRVYNRQLRYARVEFTIRQRQERAQRRAELRQARMEVTGGGFSVGAGGFGGLGGYGGGGGGGFGMMGGGGFGMMGGGFGMMGGGFMD